MSTASAPVPTDRPRPLPGTRGTTAPDGRPFVWGPVDNIHVIGQTDLAFGRHQYAVVEFRVDKGNSPQPEYWHEHGKTMYQAYLDGRDTHASYDTMESALVHAIEIARLGTPNLHVTRHFDAMTRKDDDQ